MKKLITLVLLLGTISYSQKIKVTFEVIVDSLPDTSAVYITGNRPEFGEWKHDFLKLNKESDTKWKTTLQFDKGTDLEYKYTLGSWSKEALDKDGKVPDNYRFLVSNDTIVTVRVNSWGSSKKPVPIGQITGTVKYHRSMKGDNIKPRDIIVWLPPDYDKAKNKRYPVLYAHDGQNLLDPATSAFGIDWQLDETSDSLIRQGKIKEFIIVGIYNTTDRAKEYIAGNAADAYMNFIVNKLKPFIDKTYRTLKDKKNTVTMGSSAGGTISFLLLMMHNNTFGKAACLSPAFKHKGKDFVAPFRSMSSHTNIRLYMDDGGVGLDSLLLPGIEDMIAELKAKGYKEEKDFTFYFDKEAEHNEEAWARRLWRPLTYLFNME